MKSVDIPGPLPIPTEKDILEHETEELTKEKLPQTTLKFINDINVPDFIWMLKIRLNHKVIHNHSDNPSFNSLLEHALQWQVADLHGETP